MHIHQENKLSVRLFGAQVGVLTHTPKAKLQFVYDKGAHSALSQSLPLKDKTFEHRRCFAYFAGLIPEGDKSLPLLSRILGVNQNDCFNLLKIMGMDCPGAVSFHPLDERIRDTTFTPLRGEILDAHALENQLQTLPQAPLFFNKEKVHVTLAGTMNKAAICLIEDKIAIPDKGCFSTHILKPAIGIDEAALINEYFCMRLGARLGINIAKVTIQRAHKTAYLLVERFDREIQGSKILHFHQEDFCQALGVMPYAKYPQDGGPQFKTCFQLLQKTNIPAISRNKIMSLIAFNYLISNYSAHAKEFAIKYITPKQFELAPFYDLQCSVLLSNRSHMAMKIGGTYHQDEVNESQWQQFCALRGYSYPAFKLIMQAQKDKIIDLAKEEKISLKEAGFDTDMVDKIIGVIQKNIKSE